MATLSLELVPFPVPNEVSIKMPAGKRQDGMKPLPTLALEDLSTEALEALLSEFCEAVMAKAKKDTAE